MSINLSIYQIILIIISSYFIFNRIVKVVRKEKNQSLFKLFLTLCIWGAVLIFSIFPSFSHSVSYVLGLGSNLNSLIFIGFIIIFIIIFKLITIIEEQERSITEIIRREALKDILKLAMGKVSKKGI